MKLTLFLVFSCLAMTTFAQPKNNELGIKLGTIRLVDKQLIPGNDKFLSYIPTYRHFNYSLYSREEYINGRDRILTTGFSVPEIRFRKRIYRRWWSTSTVNYASIKKMIDSSKPLVDYYSTGGAYYSRFKYRANEIQLATSVQYQWLSKKIKAYSGIQGGIHLSQVSSDVKGISWGCFGEHEFEGKRNDKFRRKEYTLLLNQYISMKVYRNYNLGYELLLDPFNNIALQSILISRSF